MSAHAQNFKVALIWYLTNKESWNSKSRLNLRQKWVVLNLSEFPYLEHKIYEFLSLTYLVIYAMHFRKSFEQIFMHA